MLQRSPSLKQNFADLRLREQRNRKLSVRTLYNAGDEPISQMHDGVPYVIPPDGASERRFGVREGISEPGLVKDKGAHAVYNGELKIYDRYGVDPKDYKQYIRDKKQDPNVPKPHARKLLAAAMDIAEFITRKRGLAGVVMLTGDPKEDTDLKRVAKAQWVLFKREQVKRVLNEYEKRTAAFLSSPASKGQFAPAMDDYERRCQKWKDRDDLGLRENQPDLIACPEPTCGFRDEKQEDMDIHVQARHQRLWAELQADLEAKTAPETPPKKAA